MTTEASPATQSTGTAIPVQSIVEGMQGQEESSKGIHAPEAPPEVDFSSKFAALARKEKALTRKQKESDEKYGKFAEYEKALNDAKKNPIKFLEAAGLSYQQITDYLLNDGNPSVENQIEELKAQYAADAKAREDRETKEASDKKDAEAKHYQEIVETHKKQINAFLDSNRDTYELCALHGAAEDVFEVIEEYYNTNNEILSIDKAADAVEKYLEAEAEKLFVTKKFAAKRQTLTDGSKTLQPMATKTITNNMGEFSASDFSHLSDEQSKKEAAKLIKWT